MSEDSKRTLIGCIHELAVERVNDHICTKTKDLDSLVQSALEQRVDEFGRQTDSYRGEPFLGWLLRTEIMRMTKELLSVYTEEHRQEIEDMISDRITAGALVDAFIENVKQFSMSRSGD